MSPLLEVNGLSVRYTSGSRVVQAVDDVSFQVSPEEVFAIVGESGCGKTATLLALAGLLPGGGETVGGSVWFEGRNLLSLSSAALNQLRGRRIGVVFQEPKVALNPIMPVGRQVAETVARHDRIRGRALRERVVELLDLVGIPDPALRTHSFPHELSGGLAQRVMIALAIAGRPALLLADEPTTALDVTVQAAVLQMLDRLRRQFGMAVVLVTHDLGVVASIADRVMVMYAGHDVETTTVGRLFHGARHPYTAALLAAVRRMGQFTGQRQSELPGMVPVLRVPASHCTFVDRCGRGSEICASEVPPRVFDELGGAYVCFHPMGERRSTER